MEYGNGATNCLVWKTTENRYHHEEDCLTVENLNVNISILGREIADHSFVLDIGCGEGKLAELIKAKSCTVFGIDIDTAAIQYALAKERYLDVFNFNVEQPSDNAIEYERFKKAGLEFDYIVIADILEHTINPTKVLYEISGYLKNEGKILVSVPNVNNVDIILNLLRGRFNYMQAGILDNTHTKYFTKSSFVEWIKDANSLFDNFSYDCHYLGGTFGLTDYMNRAKKTMPFLYQVLQLNPEYNVIQNLFILSKKNKNVRLSGLEALLSEERLNIAQILSDYLEKGMDEQFVQQINGIKLLDNERTLLEERVRSSETGWQDCDRQLTTCRQELEKLSKRNEALETEYRKALSRQNELLDGWQNCDRQLQECKQEVEKLSERNAELLEEWQKANQKYEETMLEWQKANQKYEETMLGWQKANQKYEEAMLGWQKCNEALEEAKKLQK